jgi:S1-C subfamily serine protease
MRVVIAPETSVTERVDACLRAWSHAGLLERFCVWRVPLDVQAADARGVALVDSGGVRVGTLPELLQDTPSDQITLLGFYASEDGEPFDPRFSARVTECLQHAAHVLAYDKARPVECTMVVAPSRIAQPVHPDVLCGTRNLYVAPEDRSTPPAPNQLPDSDGALPRHAAHALATIADLWVSPERRSNGVLETVAAEDVNAIDPPAVRLVRCFSRAVDFGYMADHVAAGVFQAGEEWPNPDPDHCDRVSDPSRLVKQSVREFMKIHGEALGLSKFEPLTLPAEKRPSLLEAARELVGMLLARIRRLPSDLADATLGSAHDLLADRIDKLRGPDAPRTLRWRERPESERSIADVADQLNRPVSMPDGPTAAIWHDLRRLVFALVDGSELPAGMDPAAYSLGDKRALVAKPAALAPDPSQAPPGRAENRPCDPLNLDPRFAEKPEEGEDVAEDEALLQWLEGARPALLWGVGHEISSALKAARSAAAELDEQVEAEKDSEDGEPDGADRSDSGGSTSASKSRWRGLRNSLLFNTALALFASVVVWAQLDPAPALAAQALAIVAWVFGFMRLAQRFVSRERSILRAEAEAQYEIVNAALRRALHAGDEGRLDRRYAEYLDWAEIIGWMVHQPWTGEPIERVEVRGAIPPSTLPAAFRVGVARIPESTLDRLRGQARARVFATRWLTAQYDLVEGEAMERAAAFHPQAGGGRPNPDADTLDDPDSPRRQLLAAIRRGDGRRLHDNEMTGEVLRFIDRVPLDAAADEVRSAPVARSDADDAFGADQLAPLPPCSAWFSPPASLPKLAPRLLGAVIRVAANSPAGPRAGLGVRLTPDGPAVTSLSVVADASTVRVTLPDDSQCEASVLRAMPEADLALLDLDGAPQSFDEPLALGDSELLLGDPVLAPSPPNGEAGDPALALGLVTAEYGRRASRSGLDLSLIGATYRTAAGPAGTPVFDLQGRLVGIHAGAASAADNGNPGTLRSAVQASAVQALLDADDTDEDTAEAASAMEPPREPRSSAGDSGDLVVAAPSQFVGALFPALDGPVGLLPQHWVDPDDQHLTEAVQGLPQLEGADLSSLSSGAHFMRPLRILVHRVDMTPAVAASELASCAPGPTSSPGSA